MQTIKRSSKLLYALAALGAFGALGFTPAVSAAAECHWHCESLTCDSSGKCTGTNCYQHCTAAT